MSKLQAIESSIANADNWEQKGQPGWVCKCLSSALMNYISIALDKFTNFETGRSWLREQNVDDILSRYLNALMSVVADVEDGATPESVLGGNYHHLSFVHLAWALEQFEVAESLIKVADRAGVREVSTPFWREYCSGLKSLMEASPYTMSQLSQTRDLENYWMLYLELMENISKSKPTTEILARIDESFCKRNSDNSIKDDQYEIEGSGQHPVNWDFRKETLNSFATRQTSLN